MALAAGASLLLNVAMLVPSLYTLQVFDRVFASRSVETLVMLERADAARAGLRLLHGRGALARLGARRPHAAAPAVAGRARSTRCASAAARRAAAPNAERLRDVAQLRNFLGGGGVRALFDAPWLPIYLLVIGLMHPLLGVTAALGALVLALLAVATERLTREATQAALRSMRAASAATPSRWRGNAEVMVAHGHGGEQRSAPGAAARAAAGRAGAARRALGAPGRAGAHRAPGRADGGARHRRLAGGRRRRLAGHHGRRDHPARPRAAAGGAADQRLEAARRCARRVATPVRASARSRCRARSRDRCCACPTPAGRLERRARRVRARPGAAGADQGRLVRARSRREPGHRRRQRLGQDHARAAAARPVAAARRQRAPGRRRHRALGPRRRSARTSATCRRTCRCSPARWRRTSRASAPVDDAQRDRARRGLRRRTT